MSTQNCENGDNKSITCTQTRPQSNLNNCTCKEYKQSNGHNSVTNGKCTNSSDSKENNFECDTSNETRYKVFLFLKLSKKKKRSNFHSYQRKCRIRKAMLAESST